MNLSIQELFGPPKLFMMTWKNGKITQILGGIQDKDMHELYGPEDLKGLLNAPFFNITCGHTLPKILKTALASRSGDNFEE